MTLAVLLVEEGWHSTMPIAAALEAAGHSVTVLTANGTTASCRHRTARWTSGPPIESDAFVPHLDALMRDFDRVIPLTEAAMARLWDADATWRDRIFPRTDAWQRRLVRDKHALIEHLAARGIAVPHHVRIDATTALEPPIVIKGSSGSGGKQVRIALTRAELEAALGRARELGGAWIAQQLVAGPTYLFGGVFHHGQPLRIYAAEKLEQHPARTGGAIRLRSYRDDALVELGLRAIRELQWTGFASADLVKDDQYRLLEVNPRLWGSYAGAAAAGVDLFAPFAELLAGRTPPPDLAYAPNVDCMIFPRYLNAARYRSLAGARQALRDLRQPQARDWLDPRFVVHVLRRLYWMRRTASRF